MCCTLRLRPAVSQESLQTNPVCLFWGLKEFDPVGLIRDGLNLLFAGVDTGSVTLRSSSKMISWICCLSYQHFCSNARTHHKPPRREFVMFHMQLISLHRRHQAHRLPRRPPPRRPAQCALRAALPRRHGDAVAAGGPAEGAGREAGGGDVHAAHRQGSARPHGPLHLPGGEHQGAQLHLRLRER